MKNILLYILVLFCVSCIDRQADNSPLLPELKRAEDLMFSDTDSALHILQQMPMPGNRDRLQHATWALLMAEALYKTDVRQNDSLVNIACSYFLPRDDAGRRALSLYLKGCIYDEAHREDEALPLLLQASEEITQTTDYRLGHLNEAEIGIMYARRDLYEEANAHLQKALDYAILFNDSDYIASSYQYLARIPDLQNEHDKAISLYMKGLSFSPKGTYSEFSIYGQLASVFRQNKEYDKALFYDLKGVSLGKNKYNLVQNYLNIGNTYYAIGKKDSSIHYLKLATLTDNLYTARGAYRSLRRISKESNDYKTADSYADKLITIIDSIQKTDRDQALLEIQNKYDEQVLINKNNLLQLRYDKIIRDVLIGIVLVIIVVSFIIYRYKLRIRKKIEEIKLYSLQISENNKLIFINRVQIEQLQKKIEEQKELQNKCDEIQEALGILNVNLHDRNLYYTDQIINLVTDFKKLKKHPRTLTELDIMNLRREVNQYFDYFLDRLRDNMPKLTDGDFELCALIKLGFNIKDISVILNIDSTSVSTRKYRMQKRILESIGSFGSEKNMENWLRGQ